MDVEIFDDEGYPTDEFLAVISGWCWTRGHDELLHYAMSGHTYPNYWSRELSDINTSLWNISTGGWSGNESIIGALQENSMFWMACWQQSRRGGHYIFKCRLPSTTQETDR